MNPIDKKIEENEQIIKDIVKEWGFSGGVFGTQEEATIRIKRWFHNFDPSEFDYAMLLLSHMQYYDYNVISKYIETLSNEILNIFNNDLTDVRFYPLGNSSGSSGGNFLYTFSKKLGVPSELMPNRSFKELDYSKIKALVFIDDIIGSGNQAISFAKDNLNNIPVDKYYFTLIAFEQGYNKIKNEACFKEVISCKKLSDEYKAFSDISQIFTDADVRHRLKIMCIKYGEKLFPKHPLGYDDSQALISFYYNVPNNTLPVIWASANNEKNKGEIWEPVLERKKSPKIDFSEKPNGSLYEERRNDNNNKDGKIINDNHFRQTLKNIITDVTCEYTDSSEIKNILIAYKTGKSLIWTDKSYKDAVLWFRFLEKIAKIIRENDKNTKEDKGDQIIGQVQSCLDKFSEEKAIANGKETLNHILSNIADSYVFLGDAYFYKAERYKEIEEIIMTKTYYSQAYQYYLKAEGMKYLHLSAERRMDILQKKKMIKKYIN